MHARARAGLLASLKPLRRGQTVVAFAAETEDLEARGRRKMESKGADLVVVNDVGRDDIGFDADENEVLILARDGARELVSRRRSARSPTGSGTRSSPSAARPRPRLPPAPDPA